MGKYDEHAYEHEGWSEYEEAVVQLTAHLANELAEANRLKRLKLQVMHYDHLNDEDLEDKA